MKAKFQKKYNAVIAFLISILGFPTACEMSVDEYGAPAEYGVPYGVYEVTGIVTNENDEPVENIQVTMRVGQEFSAANGSYTISQQDGMAQTNDFILQFRDIDGIEHGEYSDLDTTVTFNDTDLSGDTDGWYQGKASKTVNIKLKPKN